MISAFIIGCLCGLMFGGFYVYERASEEGRAKGYDEAWKVAWETIQQVKAERE